MLRSIPRTLVAILTVLTALSLSSNALAQQQPNPDSPRFKGYVALQEFMESDGDAAVEDFIENRIDAEVREKLGDAALRETLAAMRTELGGLDGGVQPVSELAVQISVPAADGSRKTVVFRLSSSDTDRFVHIKTPTHEIK